MQNRTYLKRYMKIGIGLMVLLLMVLAISHLSRPRPPISGGAIQIVAAENFWGSLASQLGGQYVHVTSLVSDPNADPHEFASTAATGRAYDTAQYVIENGAGYDSWSDDLLKAHQDPARKVLNIAHLIGKKNGDNPHFWYGPAYVNLVVMQIERDLLVLDPQHTSYYQQRYEHLQLQLAGYQQQIAAIKQQYAGTKVAATEDVFTYLASATGLQLISPPPFMQAIAEGSSDPPANSVVQFQQQLESSQVRLLVYNAQTITRITDSMKRLALQRGIPVVGITETIQPPNAPFQDWMSGEIMDLEKALQDAQPST